MRKSILNLLGGAFFGLLTLAFTACGNIDNPLEEIGNSNSKVAALAGALDEGAEVTFNFTMHAEAYVQFMNALQGEGEGVGEGEGEGNDPLLVRLESGSIPMKVVFKKKSGKYEYELAKAYIDGEEIYPEDYDYYSRLFTLDYVSKNNQLKVSFVTTYDEEDNDGDNDEAGTRAYYSYPAGIPLSTIIFDIKDDAFSQYVYPCTAYVVLESIEVNGENKTNLLKDKYPTKASFYWNNVVVQNALGPIDYVVGTRGEGPDDNSPVEMFCVFYKEGETWAEVNERYKKEAGNPLLEEPGDGDIAFLKNSISDNLHMPFFYKEEVASAEDLTQVKYSEKVGSDGYWTGYYQVFGLDD